MSSKKFRICIGVLAGINLTLIFIKGEAWECWGVLVMLVVLLPFAYVSKKLVKQQQKDEEKF
ncbi:MAG: hypothetical protein LBF69_07800 [Prevotellaceae bacterium]|jgi:hypothetical protein|nr:hypothetical protein [Prevotellaceae bacterium]